MNTPNRMLQELGEHAARYNRRVTEHAANCCPVCRRLLTDIIAALLDPSNWQPESIGKQLDRLRDEMESLREHTNGLVTPVAPVAAPIETDPENPSGGFFPPPPRDDE